MSERAELNGLAQNACLSRLLNDAGYRREVVGRSGLSDMTLRDIAQNGSAKSYVSALALEHATRGEIIADEIADPKAKGANFYRNPSARALLNKAMDEGITLARLLSRHGLTKMELWSFVNAEKGKCRETKERVKSVLLQLGLPCDEGGVQ